MMRPLAIGRGFVLAFFLGAPTTSGVARAQDARVAGAPLLLPVSSGSAPRAPAIRVVVLPFRVAIPQAEAARSSMAAARPRPPLPGPGGVFVPHRGGIVYAAPPGGRPAPPPDTAVVPALPVASSADGDPLGAAVADLLVAQLLATGRFQVLDAAQLEALRRSDCPPRRGQRACAGTRSRPPRAGELFLVTGSITRLGSDDRSVGLLGGARGVLGALGLKRQRTQVGLTARVVDAASGEVVASVSATGTSRKGGGAMVGGMGHGAGGGVAIGGRAHTAATGEAMDRAVAALARALLAAGPAAGPAGGVNR